MMATKKVLCHIHILEVDLCDCIWWPKWLLFWVMKGQKGHCNEESTVQTDDIFGGADDVDAVDNVEVDRVEEEHGWGGTGGDDPSSELAANKRKSNLFRPIHPIIRVETTSMEYDSTKYICI